MTKDSWSLQSVDGGVLAFDRRLGLNLLVRNERTIAERREAPRSLQIGLLTPCNLSCDFCYRDTAAPSRLTADFLVDLLTRAAKWGVLEVSFGGGEPLLFKGFVSLVRQLHERTLLGINFTTNGTLLTPELCDELRNIVGEIRVSAYMENLYRRTLRLLGDRAGLNLLVTPANLGLIEAIVKDALRQRARNILLLGYKGSDARLHLSATDLQQFRTSVLRMQHLPLRLDICWYPLLMDLPHLFRRADCGAGDEFLVITPDRAVQPCSFHHERIPFDTFEDLQRIYYDLRTRRPPANIGGCTRRQFKPLPVSAPETSAGIWCWQARSSNNSGDWTIVGRFRSAELARQVADALRRLSRAHEAFLASPEGQTWIEQREFNGSWPTPPLEQFGNAHGFTWSAEGDGLWWEEDGCGAPVLTAGAVGDTVVVYHPYCMGLPDEPFRKFFAAVGATRFGYWQYDQPRVIATAQGNCPDAVRALQRYLELVEAAEYPGDVAEPPPWGAECGDPRLLDDEDRIARLASGTRSAQVDADHIRLELTFENTFAGALALERWLSAAGYTNVVVQIDCPQEPLTPGATPLDTTLFADVQPMEARVATMSNAELIDTLFAYHSTAPDVLEQAVARIPVIEQLPLARAAWKQRRQPGVDVDWQALLMIERLRSAAADWMLEVWPLLVEENFRGMGIAVRAMAAALPVDEAFNLTHRWLATARDASQFRERLMYFGFLRNPRTIALIEDWWERSEPNVPITGDWGALAAASLIDWPALRRWLERGRPFSLISLAALGEYAQNGLPLQFNKPQRSEFVDILKAYQSTDPAPRASASVDRMIAAADKFTAGHP